MSRDAEIGAASGCPPAAITLEFRLIDQGFELLLITNMESLGYHIAQVIGMHSCVALCIVNLCLGIQHDSYSL